MVKVESVVKLAAGFLSLGECIQRVLEDDSDGNDMNVFNAFLRCYNLVETQIATDYAPLVCEETIAVKGGKVEYEKLSRAPAFIIGAFDSFGQKTSVRVFPTYFAVADGTYTVRYAALPVLKNINDDGEVAQVITERTIAYGIAAEYCVQTGLYAEAAVWEKKYKDALAGVCKQRGVKTMKGRNWV